MTLDTFFKKFDQFADAPDAVAKMRELVLNLAIQGKLVPQDSNDEPASMLLKQIEKKKGKTFDPVETENVPYSVPSGWAWVKLGFVADVERGGSPRPIQEYITNDPDGLNWIKIGDTEKGGRYITSTREKIRKEGLKKTRKVYPGDFLLTNSMSFGRPYISKIEGCIHDGWLRIHPPSQITPEYLYHLLSSAAVYAFFCKSAAGAVVQNLNADKVRELPLPLPPLAEQKRIVAKVDELMALCDRLEAQQQERDEQASALARASLARFAEAPTPANLNLLFHKSYSISPADLRKAILAMAVHGKLVSQDYNDEPAIEIVKRAIDEKARLVKQGELKREKPLPRNDNQSFPYHLPKGWCWVRLGELSHTVTSGSRDWATHYSDDGAIFVRMGNLSRNSYRLRMEKIQYIKPPSNTEGQRTKLESGDILISITGEVGLLGLIPEEFGEAYINQHTCLVRLPRELHNRYIPEFFRSPVAQDQFNAPQRGLKNSFRLSDVTTLLTPLPPLAEQRRIVAKVDQLMTLVDQLETQLAASRATAKNLLEALVDELTTR